MIAIYARVSTDEQAIHGASIASQIEACRAKISNDEDIMEFVDAGVSGTTLDRPALNDLRLRCQNGEMTRIVVLDPDRLSRKLAHQLLITDEWERLGILLEFVNFEWQDTPEGRLFYSLRGAIAEFEREKILERTRRGWLMKARQGQLVAGMQRFGYAYDAATKTIREDPETAAVVRRIFQLAAEEHLSTGRIAERLAAEGIPAPRGAHWWRDTVSKILRNPAYMGIAYVHQYDSRQQFRRRDESEWIPITVPALIDEATWLRAREVIYHYRKFWKGRQELPALLRRLVACGRCGHPLSTNSRAVGGQTYVYYFCPHRYPRHFRGDAAPERCTLPWIRAEAVDDEVWATVARFLAGDADEWTAIESDLIEAARPPQDALDHWHRELERVNRARQRILSLVSRDLVTDDEADSELRRLRQEAQGIQEQLARHAAPRPSLTDRVHEVRQMVESADLQTIPFASRIAVVRELIDHVTLNVDNDGHTQVAISFRS